MFDGNLEFNPQLLKDKDQMERFSIRAYAYPSVHFLKKLFACIPANLSDFSVPYNAEAPLLVREEFAKIIENNEALLRCQIYGRRFCYKFEEITDRNKRLKNEGRFKVTKVAAPQD